MCDILTVPLPPHPYHDRRFMYSTKNSLPHRPSHSILFFSSAPALCGSVHLWRDRYTGRPALWCRRHRYRLHLHCYFFQLLCYCRFFFRGSISWLHRFASRVRSSPPLSLLDCSPFLLPLLLLTPGMELATMPVHQGTQYIITRALGDCSTQGRGYSVL